MVNGRLEPLFTMPLVKMTDDIESVKDRYSVTLYVSISTEDTLSMPLKEVAFDLSENGRYYSAMTSHPSPVSNA